MLGEVMYNSRSQRMSGETGCDVVNIRCIWHKKATFQSIVQNAAIQKLFEMSSEIHRVLFVIQKTFQQMLNGFQRTYILKYFW